MHKVLKAFPCSFDGVHTEDLQVGDERDFGSMAAGLKKADLIGEPDRNPLRDDGPTVAEYVAAGYMASNYPPKGYASRSTPEEIAEAVRAGAGSDSGAVVPNSADVLRAELTKMTSAQLREKAVGMKIDLAADTKKDDLISAIVAATSSAA